MTRKRFESLNHDELMAVIYISGEYNCHIRDIEDVQIEYHFSKWTWKDPLTFRKLKKMTFLITWTKTLNYMYLEGKISI